MPAAMFRRTRFHSWFTSNGSPVFVAMINASRIETEIDSIRGNIRTANGRTYIENVAGVVHSGFCKDVAIDY